MDLDDVLEDLLEGTADRARDGLERARDELRQRSRMPGFRRRLRAATLWASGGWLITFGGLSATSAIALDGGPGTALAVVFGGIAAPAVPTGIWAWRARRREAAAEAQALAQRAARRERAELPRAVAADWVRLRKAQQLVEDLAGRGLVDVAAIGEQRAMVDELHALLVADRRAVELGGTPSAPLRQQVADLADLLVALAVEAVEAGSEAVDHSGAPATLRDAHERLVALRAARTELGAVEVDRGAAVAAEMIERERAVRQAARDRMAPRPDAVPEGSPDARPDDGPGEQRPMPG